MEHKPRPGSGGMEGDGAYNRHAKFQADGGNLALLLIQEAAENIEVGNEPIVIADYGSSQGRNSLKPIRAAIDALHRRIGSGQPIVVYHIDLPVNDFSSLFKTLDADADSYSASLPNVYPCAVGRSFYESVLPAGCVHIGWSAYAVQWLSRIPTIPVDHFWFTRLNAAARAIYKRQAAKDWESFLTFRAGELRPGGRLVVVCPGVGDCQTIADQVDPVIADMVKEKAISREERARMVIASWQRSEREYLAPFHRDAQFQGLTVEHCESVTRTDQTWEQYQRDGDVESFATKQAAHFRATFIPSLTAALAHADEPKTRQDFADRLEHGLKQRLLRQPTPYSVRVDTIVFAKASVPIT